MTSPVHLTVNMSKDVVCGPLEKVLAFSKGNPWAHPHQPLMHIQSFCPGSKKKEKTMRVTAPRGEGLNLIGVCFLNQVRNEVKLIANGAIVHQPRSSGSVFSFIICRLCQTPPLWSVHGGARAKGHFVQTPETPAVLTNSPETRAAD